VCVRVVRIKLNGSTKYVELSVEYFWTRVRFPPPPPEFFPGKLRETPESP
jgi:hypothetical protein